MIIQLDHAKRSKKLSKDGRPERESPRCEALLHVRNADGKYVRHMGNLGIGGCFFQTSDFMVLGQEVDLVLALQELDLKVKVKGKIIRTTPARRFIGVAVKFDELSFDTERMIARWLDLRTSAAGNDSYAA